MKNRQSAVCALALIGCFLALLLGASTGALHFSPHELWLILTGQRHDALARAFLELRLPRLCNAMLVGAALALAGALLQGLLRNPLVDPYLTGSSAGTTCALALAVAFGLDFAWWPLVGFFAALGTALVTLFLARSGQGISVTRFLLAGVSLSAFCAAVVTLVLTVAPSNSVQLSLAAWVGGSLAGRGWPECIFAARVLSVGAVFAFLLAPTLNALRLGESRAQALGIHPGMAQWAVLATASCLTAGAVSLAGMVGFVGLIVPHLARRWVGSDARWVFPVSMLLGAALVLLADALVRGLLPPLELPLGVLLAFLGVPLFLFLAYRERSLLT